MATPGLLVFAGKSVAGSVIKEIVTKAFTYLDGYFGTESMEEMKNKLEEGMPQIQAVLDVVNPDNIKDQSEALDRWFWKLRDVVEEAEDAIDELEYYELEEKANDRKVSDWGSPFSKMKNKVVKSVKRVSVLDKILKKFTHHGILKRLKKAMEDLDKAALGTARFLEVVKHLKGDVTGCSRHEDLVNSSRQTGSTLTVTKLFGREKEKKRVLEWLTKKTSFEDGEIVTSTNDIPILSLVGHGGMGKTTLAQSICEQGEVVRDFKIIWVTVSTTFDATTVTRKILESINRENPKADSLEALQQLLKDKLKSVKFLLILDDVWEEEGRNEWEKLFAPLRTGTIGSKILLTTRMASVASVAANVMGVERVSLTLEGLEEGENLDLFNHHVFAGLNPEDYEHLEPTGKQISRKLGGCPLVTKVVSGHLQGNMTIEFWSRFLHEGLQHFKGNADDIMKVLRLSYYHLPTELQICFRYCSLFPQDYNFKKKDLVLMWIGSGLISTAGNKTKRLEDIGEQYLFQLTRKSFFEQKIRVEHTAFGPITEESYAMHDLMHELAEYVSSGECKRISSPARLEDVKDTIRHLWVDDIHSSSADDVKKIMNFKNLRTLIIGESISSFVCQYTTWAINTVLENSRALRLLQFKCHDQFDFPRKVGNLKHLRYMSLSRISPESIHRVFNLYHLVLFWGCYSSNGYQPELNAKQVRCLGNLDRLQYLSYGIGGFGEFSVNRLTCLQELNNYRVQGGKGNKISAIRSLRDLRELKVQGLENVDNDEEAANAKLKEKEYLMSLSLEWSASACTHDRTHDMVLDNLEPHANISKLEISGYDGTRLPVWIENLSVKQLASLKLKSCMNWEYLPSLRGLVLLKCLILDELPKLQKIGWSSHVFSSGCIDSSLPPYLDTLVIRQCPELRELSILPPSLVYLKISDVGLTRLPMMGKLCNEGTEIKKSHFLDISVEDCPGLTSFEGSLLEQKQYMAALRTLRIIDCVHLESTSFPFEEMNGLKDIEISNCPKLMTLRDARDKVMPLSLTRLTMRRCAELALPLLRSLQSLTNLNWLRLEDCSNIVSLPSADVFKSLKSLRSMGIIGCENLSSLGGLGSLQFLSHLEISSCTKLLEATSSLPQDASGGEEEHPVVPLQIDNLQIDLPTLLLVEPVKSLSHTQSLKILDGSEMESLPMQWLLQNSSSLQFLWINEARSVESLPPSLLANSSLLTLGLEGVGQGRLPSLPDLPSSLRWLSISGGYLDLEERIREDGSSERSKISHITRVEIGNSFFIMGKECCKETYNKLWGKDNNMLSSWVNSEDVGKGVDSAVPWWKKQCCMGANCCSRVS